MFEPPNEPALSYWRLLRGVAGVPPPLDEPGTIHAPPVVVAKHVATMPPPKVVVPVPVTARAVVVALTNVELVAKRVVAVAAVNVCPPVQVFGCARAREATTAPLVGLMVSVPSEFETELTDPPPEPQSLPVPDTTPVVLTWRHWVEPVIEERVRGALTVVVDSVVLPITLILP